MMLIWLLSSLLWGVPGLCFLSVEIRRAAIPTWCLYVFWGSKFQALCWCGKPFHHRVSPQPSNFLLLRKHLHLFICVYVHTWAWCVCGGQKTTCRSQGSPPCESQGSNLGASIFPPRAVSLACLQSSQWNKPLDGVGEKNNKEWFCKLMFLLSCRLRWHLRPREGQDLSTASTMKEALVGSTKRRAWASIFSSGCGSGFHRCSAALFLPSLSQLQSLNTAFSTSVSISPWMLPVIFYPIGEGEWSFAFPDSQRSWGLL